jgi:hypothetical protein
MARDAVANVVMKLSQRGFDPRRLGPDSWESRCPAHGGKEYAVAISLNEQDVVVLNCRIKRCPASAILRALDLSAVRLYANTPNWVLRKLCERPIVPPIYVESAAEAPPRVLKSPPKGPALQPSQTKPRATPTRTSSSKDTESPLPDAERLRSLLEQLNSPRATNPAAPAADPLPKPDCTIQGGRGWRGSRLALTRWVLYPGFVARSSGAYAWRRCDCTDVPRFLRHQSRTSSTPQRSSAW